MMIDGSLARGGCSGGGMFITAGRAPLYVGPVTSAFVDDPLLQDVGIISRLGGLGEDGFNKLLASAIADYKSKNP